MWFTIFERQLPIQVDYDERLQLGFVADDGSECWRFFSK